MSLPLILLFERHWDEAPKQLFNDLLPKLAEEGYDTFCFEAPQNLSSNEILQRHNDGIEFDSQILSKAHNFLSQRNIKTDQKLSDISFTSLSELMRQCVSSQRYLKLLKKLKTCQHLCS